VIAKHGSSSYVNERSRDWLKFKCVGRQEFVVGGFTDPEGQRVGLGALLLGYYDDDQLQYAGKVGTRFEEETLATLRHKLEKIECGTPAFDGGRLPHDGVHWGEPKYVVEVGFTEWTKHGKLRHPRYLGLRRDKEARQVVREG